MDPRLEVRARAVYRVVLFVAGLAAVQILFMAGLAAILTDLRPGGPASDATAGLLIALLAIAASFAVGAVYIRHFAVKRALASGPPTVALGRIRTGIIIACVFAETPSLLGFSWLILGGSILWAPVFWGSAVASLVLVFPHPSQWQEWLAGVASATGEEY